MSYENLKRRQMGILSILAISVTGMHLETDEQYTGSLTSGGQLEVTTVLPQCPADLNGDHVVNAADLALLLGVWGSCTGCAAEMDGNNVVNSGDLALLLGAWGPCPVCGNGIIEPGEECDPPAGVTCDDDCQLLESCAWDNGAPLDDFETPASQYAPDWPFTAESADDFILTGDVANPCLITGVSFWVTLYTIPVGDPATQWDGVQISFYNDDDTGTRPDSHRNDDGTFGPPGPHSTQWVPMGMVTVTDVSGSFPILGEVFQIDVPINVVLDKNTKYWFVAQPEVGFIDGGQVAVLLSETESLARAVQVFPSAGVPDWVVIVGDPTGTLTDLAFSLTGTKIP